MNNYQLHKKTNFPFEVIQMHVKPLVMLWFSVRCHIVHLSAAEALPLVRAAKSSGAHLTVETCHHYLTLNAEAIPDSAMQYKCCPPVRSLQNRVRLRLNLHDYSTVFLYRLQNIVRIGNSSRLRWAEYVTKMLETRNACKTLVRKPLRKHLLYD